MQYYLLELSEHQLEFLKEVNSLLYDRDKYLKYDSDSRRDMANKMDAVLHSIIKD